MCSPNTKENKTLGECIHLAGLQKVSRCLNVKWFYIRTLTLKLTTFLYILNYNFIIFTYVQAAFYEDKIVIYVSCFSHKMAHRGLKNDFFTHGSTALVGLGLLFIEASRSHTVNQPALGRIPFDE